MTDILKSIENNYPAKKRLVDMGDGTYAERVDAVLSVPVSVDAQIGAVEIKNATTDSRAEVVNAEETPASTKYGLLTRVVGLLANRMRLFAVAGTALTRPANQTPYSINDSVSDNATAGSVTANSVSLSDTNDDPISIRRVRLTTADTGPATAGATFEMYLFRSDPTANSGVGGGDNAAFSQKQAGFIGRLSGTFIGGTGSWSDGSTAVLTPIDGAEITTLPVSGAKTIFWQIKTLTAWTPSANSTTFTPTFEGFQGRA